jgi:hypothetical protein
VVIEDIHVALAHDYTAAAFPNFSIRQGPQNAGNMFCDLWNHHSMTTAIADLRPPQTKPFTTNTYHILL